VQGRLGTDELILKILRNHIKTYDLINIGLAEQVNAAVMLLACTWEVPVRIIFLGFPQSGKRNFGTHQLGNKHFPPTLLYPA
jgi:hypothetical protein